VVGPGVVEEEGVAFGGQTVVVVGHRLAWNTLFVKRDAVVVLVVVGQRRYQVGGAVTQGHALAGGQPLAHFDKSGVVVVGTGGSCVYGF